MLEFGGRRDGSMAKGKLLCARWHPENLRHTTRSGEPSVQENSRQNLAVFTRKLDPDRILNIYRI